MPEILIFFALVLLNGFFSMSEMALVAARRSKLEQLSAANKNAKIALKLLSQPNKFLATVQISITMIGIVAGILGGMSVTGPLTIQLEKLPIIDDSADFFAIIIITLLSTFFFLTFGELVPKRIALTHPNKIVILTAPIMSILSTIFHPLITVLSQIINITLKLIGIAGTQKHHVTDDDILQLLVEGTRTGAFQIAEKDIIENTLKVGDKKIRDFMTPTNEIVWLNLEEGSEKIAQKILTIFHEEIPVLHGPLLVENIKGIIKTKDILKLALHPSPESSIEDLLYKHKILHEDDSVLKSINVFKEMETKMILVKNSGNEIKGLITTTDVLYAIGGIVL